MNYHNTTKEAGETLKEFKGKSSNQDNIILKHFESNPEGEYSADEVWINLFETEFTPLTSVRRSINTLLKEGLVEKVLTEEEEFKKKQGIFGRPVNLWRLVKKENQLELF
jgi:Fe2+ or Zn2+ uptake regulation protein